MTAAQLGEWEAFNTLEPVGEYRRDYRIAALTAMVYNIANSFGSKTRKKLAKPKDFMPWLESENVETPQQSVEDMKKVVQGIAKVQGTRKRRHE